MSKLRLYQYLSIHNSILLKYAPIMDLNTSKILPKARFQPGRKIPIDVLVYLLTNRRIPLIFGLSE